MLRLIKNEYIKLLRKGGFIALSIIFLAVTILLPVLGYVLSQTEEQINNKLNGLVNDSLIESENKSGNTEYVNMLEFFNEEKISLYDNKDWRSFAGQVAFSSTRVAINTTDTALEDIDPEDIDLYGKFEVASLNSELDSKALCEEIKTEIKDKDLIAFKDTFTNTIYPTYKQLKEKFPVLISEADVSNMYQEYYYTFEILDKYNIKPVAKDWTFNLAIDYGVSKNEIDENNINNSEYSDDVLENFEIAADSKDDIKVAEYRLKNNISEAITETPYGNSYSSESQFFMNFMEYKMLITFAGLILFMVGIGIISKEYNQGTIKFLLVNPVKRSSIFWSKVITLVSMLVIASLWTVFTQFIFNTLFYGKYPTGIAHIYMDNGKLLHESGVMLITKNYLNEFLGAFMLCLAAIFLSALIRNGAFAAGIAFFTYLAGIILGPFLSGKGFYLFQFAMFPNVNLLSISKGNISYRMQNLTFSSIVLIVHAIIFLWAARDAFVKKDI